MAHFLRYVEKLGFNQERPPGGPTLKFLTYILDTVETPFPESRYLQICTPSVHTGQINFGLWANNAFHLGISAPVFTNLSLPQILERVMKDSPYLTMVCFIKDYRPGWDAIWR